MTTYGQPVVGIANEALLAIAPREQATILATDWAQPSRLKASAISYQQQSAPLVYLQLQGSRFA
jgi:hypothetical protein